MSLATSTLCFSFINIHISLTVHCNMSLLIKWHTFSYRFAHFVHTFFSVTRCLILYKLKILLDAEL